MEEATAKATLKASVTKSVKIRKVKKPAARTAERVLKKQRKRA